MTAEVSKKQSLRAVLFILAVFLLGMIGGAGAAVLVVKQSIQSAVDSSDEPIKPVRRAFDRLGTGLSKELKLSEGETSAVRKELEVTLEHILQLRLETTERLDREARDTIKRIESHLPESKRPEIRKLARDKLEPWGLLREGE
ncbi:MAG: hypothetical protein P1U89_10465 [Verrucomicrobiales bacterium]|nr:hypothetical protein [Verrucomicrobiales bacterium]